MRHTLVLLGLATLGAAVAVRAAEQRTAVRLSVELPDNPAVGARLFPDLAKFKVEEAKRFALVEEHWDAVVNRSE